MEKSEVPMWDRLDEVVPIMSSLKAGTLPETTARVLAESLGLLWSPGTPSLIIPNVLSVHLSRHAITDMVLAVEH